MKQIVRRPVGAAILATTLVFGGAAASHATPTPTHGPVVGGTPVTVSGPAIRVIDVSAGSGSHTLAVTEEGTSWAFGSNLGGSFGDGTESDSFDALVRVGVPEGVKFATVDAGLLRSLALDVEGNAYVWGSSLYGTPSTGLQSPSAVVMPAGVKFSSVSAGSSFYALGDDSKAYAWGSGENGALGNGENEESAVPVEVQVPPGLRFTQIDGGDQFALALDDEGQVHGWGRNFFGELGKLDNPVWETPERISGLPAISFTQVVADTYHGLALGEDGAAYVWGSVPVFSIDPLESPVRMAPPAGVKFVQLAAAYAADYALGSDGLVYAWGLNNFGELGVGASAGSSVPIQVPTPAGVTFTKVVAAASSATALTADGEMYGWGSTDLTQREAGTSPALIAGPEVLVTGVAFDGSHGTDLNNNDDGTWSMLAPEHAAGTVDVVISWSLGGVTQNPITHVDGFTYVALAVAPTITSPEDQTVRPGQAAQFIVKTTGSPAPTVTWEVSKNSGTTWHPITADTAATPSENGHNLTVIGSDNNHGFIYRATATNQSGEATSEIAMLRVITAAKAEPAVDTVISRQGNLSHIDTNLAVTGADATPVVWLVGVATLLLSAGLITANQVARRKMRS